MKQIELVFRFEIATALRISNRVYNTQSCDIGDCRKRRTDRRVQKDQLRNTTVGARPENGNRRRPLQASARQ
jgi:hypothetical protein